jgi:hypothetical protein
MRTKLIAFSLWAAPLALGITFVSLPARAQAVHQAPAAAPLQFGTGIPLPPRNVLPAAVLQRRAASAPASRPASKLMTPYDRVIAPMLAKANQSAAPRSGGAASRSASSNAAGVGIDGSKTTFPGFVAVPFLTVNDGDSTNGYISVSASFTNNGRIDVAQIKTDGTIDVILNPGTFANIASLTPQVSQSTNTSVYITQVLVADMNGDGYPDLIGMDIGNNQILVWINNGKGSFGAPTAYPVTLASGANWQLDGGSISVGDFNGTGSMSIVALTETPNLILNGGVSNTVIAEQTFINSGTGILVPLEEEDSTFPDVYYQTYEQAAVVTNDGTKASGIAFLVNDSGFNIPANAGVGIATLASNGDGTFKPAVVPANVLVQDNGVINTVDVPVNDSFVATNLSATATASTSSTINPPGTPGSGVATTDIVFMTGDGAVYDAPYTSGNPTVANLLVGSNWQLPFFGVTSNPPVSTPPSPPSLNDFSIPQQATLHVADMNGDGTPDLVVYGPGAVYIFPNAGKGVFTAAPIELAGASAGAGLSGAGLYGIQEPQPANYDGSSYNSLIDVDTTLYEFGYYHNLGAAASTQAGQFFAAPLIAGPNISGNFEELGGNIFVILAADVNGDGVPDLIGIDTSISSSGILSDNIVVGFRNGSGAGNQSNNYTFTTAITNAQISAVANDFVFIQPAAISNSTGVTLILGTTYTGPTLVSLGKNGIAGTPVNLSYGITVQCLSNYGDVGDINGDGIPDIVIAYGGDNATDYEVSNACGFGGNVPSGYFTFLGNADGTYQPATFTPLGNELYSIKLINLSGAAGNLDLVAIDPGNLSVWVVPNKADGSGTFDVARATQPVTGNNIFTDIIPGDYNSDGKQDLTLTTAGQVNGDFLVTNTSGVVLLPGNGNYTFGAPTLIDMPNYAEPEWGAYADFNGDGTPDLALAVSFNNEILGAPVQPMVQILPNLGGGVFGAPVVEMNGFNALTDSLDNAEAPGSMFVFVGDFSNSGGSDLLVSSEFGTAEFVNQGVTSLALTASSTTPGQASPVTLTATVNQVVGSGNTAAGTVTFSANGTVLGIAEVTNGVATLTTTSLPVGSDVITAIYSGDATHNQATASPLTITVATVAPGFTLTAAPATLTLVQGATGTVLVSIAGNSTFNGAITLSCSGAPTEASCAASPATVTLAAGQTAAMSIVVATTPPNNNYQAKSTHPITPWSGTLGGLSVAGLAFVLWPRRRLRSRLLAIVAVVAVALGASSALTGCSSGGQTYAGTTAGTYTLTVTATSGAITQTQTIALTITKAQ